MFTSPKTNSLKKSQKCQKSSRRNSCRHSSDSVNERMMSIENLPCSNNSTNQNEQLLTSCPAIKGMQFTKDNVGENHNYKSVLVPFGGS